MAWEALVNPTCRVDSYGPAMLYRRLSQALQLFASVRSFAAPLSRTGATALRTPGPTVTQFSTFTVQSRTVRRDA